MKLLMCILMFVSAFVCACSSNSNSKETHRKIPFDEALPMIKSAGVDALGCSMAQYISAKKYPDVKMSFKLNKEQRDYIKAQAQKYGVKLVSFGVCNPKNNSEIFELFEFCQYMGILMILSEPKPEQMPLMDTLAGKYGIKVCVHNHEGGSRRNDYYNPNIVYNLIKNYKNIYACPDTGHWSRSGVRNLDGFKVLGNKIAILHFKDQRKFGVKKDDNVPFGEGELNLPESLAYLDSIGFDGYFLIEDEQVGDNPIPRIRHNAEYLRTH